jgi:hypothetical protein
LCLGDSFLNKPGENLPQHLWFIISYPKISPEEIVIVNLTTWQDNRIGQDASCILETGEHPFIKHKSFIKYSEAKIVTKKQLIKLFNAGLVESHKGLDQDTLRKILCGAADSHFLKLQIKKILEGQNLI